MLCNQFWFFQLSIIYLSIMIIYQFVYLFVSICLSYVKASHHLSVKKFTNNQRNVLFCNQFWLFWLYIYLLICLYFCFYWFKFVKAGHHSSVKRFTNNQIHVLAISIKNNLASQTWRRKTLGKGLFWDSELKAKTRKPRGTLCLIAQTIWLLLHKAMAQSGILRSLGYMWIQGDRDCAGARGGAPAKKFGLGRKF